MQHTTATSPATERATTPGSRSAARLSASATREAATATGANAPFHDKRSARHAPAPWRALATGVGVFGGEALIGYLHPALGEATAVADVIAPLIVAVVLLMAILRGSTETCERAFRLLRWIANRPEPPAPPPPALAVARMAGQMTQPAR